MERDPLVEVADQLTGTKSGSWAKGQESERPVNRRAGSGPSPLGVTTTINEEVRMSSVQPGETYVVGVDFGTESGRAVVVRAQDGTELASAVCPYPHGVIKTRCGREC